MADRGLPRAEDRLAPDRPLDVLEWGDAGGRPVVFLHGLGPAGPRLVERAAKHWAEEHHVRVLAPAMPGWGASAPDAAEGMLPTQLAGAVERTLAAHGIHSFTLVGFSWGGNVGARLEPRRLRGLVLIDVGYQTYEAIPTLDERRAQFADVDFVEPELAAQAFHGVDVEPGIEALPAVAAAGVPILLLVATVPSVDRRAGDVARFRRLIPSAAVQEIAGEHNLLETAPEATTRAIGEFLDAVA